MRRKDREVTDFNQIVSILDKCKVLHLSMISEGKPYSVPVNFGYTISSTEEKKLTIYIHGASTGKKVSALKENPSVSFSCVNNVDVESIDKSDVACKWTCYYESVIGSGTVSFLDKSKEKTEGLDSIMMHNGYKIPVGLNHIVYNMMEVANVMVAKIEVNELTGKIHKK